MKYYFKSKHHDIISIDILLKQCVHHTVTKTDEDDYAFTQRANDLFICKTM